MAPSSTVLACPRCATALTPESWDAAAAMPCAACDLLLEAVTFPALRGGATVARPEATQGEGEASCFFHPGRRAVVPCDACGRYLCALCDLPVQGRHLCPSCLGTGEKAVAAPTLARERTNHDAIALLLVTVPWLFWPSLFVTVPLALFLVVRHWRDPHGPLPRTKVRFVLATLLALATLALACFLVYMLVVAARRPRLTP